MKTREYRTRTKVIATVLSSLIILYTIISLISAVLSLSVPRLQLKSPLPSTRLPYMEVNFSSRYDGVNLAGWFLITRGERVIVVVNGGFQNRIDDNVDTAGLAQDLAARGYDILLFDQRGRGESEGKGRALSNFESDIGGAIDYLQDNGYDLGNITLLGFCSGAYSTLLFATREDVGAVIIDGCFGTVEGMVVRQAVERNIPGLLVECFIPGMKVAASAMYGFRIVEPINEVEKVRCPVFFIHEEKDDLVTWKETLQLYKAAKNPAKEIWQVPGALHSQAYRNYPDEFVDRIDSFLSKSD